MTAVLIVDDNRINRKFLGYLLRRHGFVVEVAANADEALSHLAVHQPLVILMDLELPGTSGLELTRIIKRSASMAHVAVVAVTGQAMSGDRERILSAGFDDYVAKPIDIDAVPALVRRHAAEAQRKRGHLDVG